MPNSIASSALRVASVLAGDHHHAADDRHVMGLITDLDSPGSGFIQHDVRSLERVVRDLKSSQGDLR
jgi:hypothetical protein